MAKRIAKLATITLSGTLADTTTSAAANTFLILRGGAATQKVAVWEVKVTGLAASTSSPMEIPWGFSSTASVGALSFAASIGTDAFVDQNSSALSSPTAVGTTAATTFPQRSATLQLMDLSLNAYGGLFKWQAYDASFCPQLYGVAANLGDSIIACRAGTIGAISGHVIYEAA